MALAEHLRGRRSGVTAAQLAERFGVTLRTMYRDLDSLRAASLPLLSDRGRGGGYALDRAYNLPPVNFTAQEAAVLLAAGRMLTEQRLLPFARTLAGALDKVRSALPPAAQREAAQLAASLRFVGVPARAAAGKVTRVLEEAWLTRQGVELTYQSSGKQGVLRVRVRVSSVVPDRLETLLNTESLDGEGPRQYKLHQVLEARLLAPEL